jgi:hypothetical protein
MDVELSYITNVLFAARDVDEPEFTVTVNEFPPVFAIVYT